MTFTVRLLCITDPTTHYEWDTTPELYNRFAKDPRLRFFHAPVLHINGKDEFPVCEVSKPLPFEDFQKLDLLASDRAGYCDFDVIYNRADGPLPENFLQDQGRFERQSCFVNSPRGLLEATGKDFLRKMCGEFLPQHVSSRDPREIEKFFAEHKIIVAKQNKSSGGRGVFKLWSDSGEFFRDNILEGQRIFSSFEALLADLLARDEGPFLFARYLESAKSGDKRVLVLENEIFGAYLRRAPHDGWVHNISAGGKPFPAEVTPRETEIIHATAPFYLERGVSTLGYDFLQDDSGESLLSEINVGNVGGYGRLERMSGQPVIDGLIQWLCMKGVRADGEA